MRLIQCDGCKKSAEITATAAGGFKTCDARFGNFVIERHACSIECAGKVLNQIGAMLAEQVKKEEATHG